MLTIEPVSKTASICCPLIRIFTFGQGAVAFSLNSFISISQAFFGRGPATRSAFTGQTLIEGLAVLDEAAGDEASARTGGSWVVVVAGLGNAVGDEETAQTGGTGTSGVASLAGGDGDAA